MKKKKESKRSRTAHASLKPEYNLKSRQDLIDYDYLDQLSDKDKDWLAKFSEEYIGASFKKELPKRKGKRRKAQNLHKTKELKKSVYDANNARNRDILTRSKAQGLLSYIEDENFTELELHELLDGKKESSD